MLQYFRMVKKSLLAFIESSPLSGDDKTFWQNIEILEDSQVMVLFDFINHDEEKLIFITEHLKTSQQLLESNDEELASKIMKAVAEQLTSLTE